MEQKIVLKIKNKEIVKKEIFNYKVFEIIPSRFIESGKALEEILTTMSAIYEPRIKYDYLTKSFVINQLTPFYYEILYEGKSIHFNYVIPDKFSKILINKIDKIFRVATIKEREDYFNNFVNKYYCLFQQKKHFMFSLNADYRENSLLDNLMSILNNIQEDDKILLQIGIIPLNDNWKEEWGKANIKHRNGEELIVHTNPVEFVFDNLFKTTENLLDIFDIVIGVNKKEVNKYDKNVRQIDKWASNFYRNSHMTTQKVNYNGYETQIRVYCNNETRTRYYGKLMDAAFKILDADQELELTRIKQHKGDKREFSIQFTKQIFSTKELTHFLRLPDRRMQIDYKENLKSIEITENIIPKELQNGQIRIGETSYKGNKIIAYWNTKDYAMATQHKVIVGLQRTGKTSYIKNFAIEAIKAGHSVFILDTIKMCETANDVRDFLPVEYLDKIIVLDYSNLDYLLPLAWNELLDIKTTSSREKMMISSQIAGNLESFIESIAGLTQEDRLSPRMKKFLACSAKLVLSQPGSTIKDVLDVLQEKDIRDEFIKKSGLPETNTIVQELRRLDDGKGGTNYSLISGISDRYSIMTNDYTMDILLSTKPNPEINFAKWASEGKCVLIKMSDLKFDRRSLRPLVSFIYSKIWLSMLARGEQEQPRITHVILDEIHNFPEVTNMLRSTCRESAKFGLSYVFTNHMLTDLRALLPAIKSSGANFMLFKTTKENLKMLEEELMLGNISIEEALELKPFHSINIVNYNREYCVFNSKAPEPVEKRYKKYNRSYLDLQCSKKYGIKWEE